MPKNKKYIVLSGIILICVFLSFYAAIRHLNRKELVTDKVTMACYHGEPAALVYLAKQEGLFRDNGIEAVIKDYQAGQFAMNALSSHQADIAIVSDSTLVSNSFEHRDLKILAVIAESRARKLIARRGKAIVWGLQTYNPFYFLLATKTKWINDNPECASKIIKALVEAERIITHDKSRLRTFFQEKFSYQNECLNQAAERNLYYVYLPQALLFEFENQAFWRIKNNLTKSKKIPNYLNFIYPYALKVIDSQRVNVIR